MRQGVVLDTNVLVGAGFNPRSKSAQIVEAVRDGQLELVWHRTTKAECEKIIRKIPPLHWGHFEDLFRPESEHTDPLQVQDFSQIEDFDDRKFAALAATTKSILISNDHHFDPIGADRRIQVMSPGEFVSSRLAGRVD